MKKRLLSVVLLIFCTAIIQNIKAQAPFNKAYHDLNERACSFIVPIGTDLFFCSNSLYAPAIDGSYLYKHTMFGNLVYKQALPIATPPVIGFKTLDNQLLLAGGSQVCGSPQIIQTNYITKYNVNGTLIFNSTYTVNLGQDLITSLQLSDSGYVSFTDSLMVKHNKLGQLISKTYLGFGGISSAIVLANNNLLVSANSGSFSSFVEVAPTGTIVNVSSAPVLFTKLLNYGGQKMMAWGKDKKLYKFSPNFNLLATSNFSAGQSVADFAIKNDSLYTIRTSSLTLSSYFVSDTLFNTFWTSSTTTDKINQTAILPTIDNKVAILSTGIAHPITHFFINDLHYFTSLNVIQKFSSNNFSEDIALLSLVKDSAYTIFYGNPVFTSGNAYLRVKAKIKYLGTGKLTSFKLNAFERTAIECGNYYYQEEFTGLNVLPGDTVWVTGTQFANKYISATSQTAQAQYCYYVSVPNEQVDKNLQDNQLCKNFDFVITSNQKNVKDEVVLKLFPNPFNQHLQLQSDKILKEVKLVNGLGQVVFTKSLNSTNEQLDLPELASGIYFVNVKTESGVVLKKLIKE